MNCFQKLVSLIFWTTTCLQRSFPDRLWIAFKNLYLWYSEQHTTKALYQLSGCELLSKTCIFDILNNKSFAELYSETVVNCFQKLVSLIFWTTAVKKELTDSMLWIAFKNLYLWYSEQLRYFPLSYASRCELLSKTCIFDILNNVDEDIHISAVVVNCFQKLVSLIFWTTTCLQRSFPDRLWIAFKNLYLWYSEQHTTKALYQLSGCELLSKTCIFDILNNANENVHPKVFVVNCFQKLVSLIFWTTF